jgi:phosphoribosyl-ATP pyrophosphohydrolase
MTEDSSTTAGGPVRTETDVFEELFAVIQDRRERLPEDSYTASLFEHEKGVDAILEKLGEETTEVLLAAKGADREDLTQESADLIYHLFVLLAAEEVALDDLRAALRERRGDGENS